MGSQREKVRTRESESFIRERESENENGLYQKRKRAVSEKKESYIKK